MRHRMEIVQIDNRILFQNLDTSFDSFVVYSSTATHKMEIFEHSSQTSGMDNGLT